MKDHQVEITKSYDPDLLIRVMSLTKTARLTTAMRAGIQTVRNLMLFWRVQA